MKLGPIALQFLADVTREQADEAGAPRGARGQGARGEGSRQRGGDDRVVASPPARGTRVALATELALRGAVAQYGRGVVADVASRLTAQFADCIAGKLAAAPGEAPAPEPVPIGGLGLVLGALWRRIFRR